MFVHARSSAPKSLDGKLERFVTKKVAKVIAKLESDRLYVQAAAGSDFRCRELFFG